MEPVILFRSALAEEAELHAAKAMFNVVQYRHQVPDNSFVIGRYSVLPYYQELVEDLGSKMSSLINSYSHHLYVADMQNWYEDLKDITPKTYFSLEAYRRAIDNKQLSSSHPMVLKGETNSKKHQWHTHMLAENAEAVGRVYRNLSIDGLLEGQKICIREYEDFAKYDVWHAGAPVTDEYRFFVLEDQIVVAGYYWSEHYDEIVEKYYPNHHHIPLPKPAISFVENEVIPRVSGRIHFYVVDVARIADTDDWMVVELNDGQMSGLSSCNPHLLYFHMKRILAQ